MKLKDTDSHLTLWGFKGRDGFLDCPAEFDEALLQMGVDPYDLEEVGNLFGCNVTRHTNTQESYHIEATPNG